MEVIGKIIATEKQPSTIENFTFWTNKDVKLKPFDVVVVDHIQGSKTYGVVEEISHMTDSPSAWQDSYQAISERWRQKPTPRESV